MNKGISKQKRCFHTTKQLRAQESVSVYTKPVFVEVSYWELYKKNGIVYYDGVRRIDFKHFVLNIRPKLNFVKWSEKYIVNLHVNYRGELIEILTTYSFLDTSNYLCLDTCQFNTKDLEYAFHRFFFKAIATIRTTLYQSCYRYNTDVSITFVFHKVIS